jgi:hypothetical protein
MMVGRTLRAIRKFHAVSIEEMAGILGTLPRVIERGIEGPRIGNGETFEMYHKHAEHFGFGIGDIFRMVDTHLLSDDTTISQRFVEEDTWGYKEMENVFSLASRLSRNGREWSLAEFQEELGESYNELIKFPLALGIVDSYVRNDMAMDFVVKARSR